MLRRLSLFSFLILVLLTISVSPCGVRVYHPTSTSFSCTLAAPAVTEYSPAELDLSWFWYKPGNFPVNNTYYRLFRTTPDVSNSTMQRLGLYYVPNGIPSIVMVYWMKNYFKSIPITYNLNPSQWYYFGAAIRNQASTVLFNFHDPSAATTTSLSQPEIIDQSITISGASSEPAIANDVLQIGYDGYYRSACGNIKEFIFTAGYFSSPSSRFYLRHGLLPKYLGIWQFSENSGQTVADSLNSRNLMLGMTTGADQNDPIWYTSNQNGIKFSSAKSVAGPLSGLTLQDSENYFTPSFKFYIRPASTVGGTIFHKGPLRISLAPGNKLNLSLSNYVLSFNTVLKVNNWNSVLIYCSNKYRPTIYCFSWVNDTLDGEIVYPSNITFADTTSKNGYFGSSATSFIGDIRHFQVANTRALLYLHGCIMDDCLYSLTSGCYQINPSNYSTFTCPTGTYKDSVTNTCTNCDPHCSACANSKGQNFACTQCASPYVLYQNNGSCLTATTPPPTNTSNQTNTTNTTNTTNDSIPTNSTNTTNTTNDSVPTNTTNDSVPTNTTNDSVPTNTTTNNTKPEIECGIQHCIYCNDEGRCLLCDSNYYLFNSACLSGCPANTTAEEEPKTCKRIPDLSQAEVNAISYLAKYLCIAYYGTIAISLIAFLVSNGDALHFFQFGISISLLFFPKFFNISLPDNLVLFYSVFEGQKNQVFNLPRILGKPPQEVLARHNIYSNSWDQLEISTLFFENFGGSFTVLLMVLALIALVRLGDSLIGPSAFSRRNISQNVVELLPEQQNHETERARGLLLNVLVCFFVELLKAVILQLRNPSAEHSYEIAGLVASNLFAIGIFLAVSNLFINPMTGQTSKVVPFSEKWGGTFNCFNSSKLGEWIPVLIISRASIIVFTTIQLAGHPWAQVSTCMAIHGLYFASVLQAQIFKNKFMSRLNNVFELLMLIVHAEHLMLMIQDLYSESLSFTYRPMGWAIIASTTLGSVLFIVFQFLESGKLILTRISQIIMKFCKKRKARRIAPETTTTPERVVNTETVRKVYPIPGKWYPSNHSSQQIADSGRKIDLYADSPSS